MTKTDLSRRSFIGLGAMTAALAGAGLAGCAPASTNEPAATEGANASNASGDVMAFEPSFLTAPEVPTDIKEEKDCDVVVVGYGLAGSAAAKAAAEEGAKVIVIEKQDESNYSVVSMAGDFGVVGSQIQKDLGIEWASKADIVNELMKDMAFRPDPKFLGYWYDHSGEDFDWFIEGADYEVLPTTAANQTTDKPNYIRPKCFPALEGYDWKEEYYPYFHGTITTNPNMQWACQAAQDAAAATGNVETMFGTWGEQLIKDESGAIAGIYVHDAEGAYTKINCKSVVVTTGDYGNNMEMRRYYVPWADEFVSFYGNNDAAGTVCNTGDGHLMCMWAGAKMELGPHAPMTHHMGGALGVDSYLQLNMAGKRFMNEDVPGQNIADQLSRQPLAATAEDREAGVKSWQIFDSKWPEQIKDMPDGHGYVNHYIPADQVDQYPTVLAGFGLGYTTDEMVEGAVTIKADTIEELIEKMGLPADVAKAEIERYNELCHAGFDEDFGKMPKRLFPVENPPFYACKFASAGMLVLCGGIDCDLDMRALDNEDQVIPGLYVAGNTMGRRFLVEYPVVVAGISLGTAMCFGRLAGKNAAQNI